ncbi:TPA: hypothetical protein ACH3X1_015180 [Trebouxia sp. C0004]
MAALERAEIGSDAWGSRRETKKAASRRGKSSKGAPVNDMPAEGPAIPAGGKATADNPVAPLHAADSGNDLDDNEASKGAAKAGAGTAIWQADKQRRNRQEQCYRHQGWPCDKGDDGFRQLHQHSCMWTYNLRTWC